MPPEHADGVIAVAFSPDGTLVATGGEDGAVRLWDPVTRQQVGQPLTGHTGAVLAVVFSPDGTLLVTAGEDETVRCWGLFTDGYPRPERP